MAEEWMIKDGKFTFPKRSKGKFASRKGKPSKKVVMSADKAERDLSPKKNGKVC